jgi:hypothetical protein
MVCWASWHNDNSVLWGAYFRILRVLCSFVNASEVYSSRSSADIAAQHLESSGMSLWHFLRSLSGRPGKKFENENLNNLAGATRTFVNSLGLNADKSIPAASSLSLLLELAHSGLCPTNSAQCYVVWIGYEGHLLCIVAWVVRFWVNLHILSSSRKLLLVFHASAGHLALLGKSLNGVSSMTFEGPSLCNMPLQGDAVKWEIYKGAGELAAWL